VTAKPRLELEWLPGRYAVCRLEPNQPIPAWVACESAHQLLSITRTERELSIVIDEDRVPEDVKAERGFVAMRVVGTLDFSLTGIIARLTTPLAEAGIPVFVISTFETDVVMVAEPHRKTAESMLDQSGQVAFINR
jgi:uncharacterized protein